MMNVMTTTGFGFGFGILWILHMLAVIAFVIGLVFLIVFAIRSLTQAELKAWAIWLLIGSTIICLFTIGMIGSARNSYGMMHNVGLAGKTPMNWNTWTNNDEESSAPDQQTQAKEEAEGKVLYEKIGTKQVTCADLKDSDFELIGEYVMGKKLGATHEQMNTRIKQMMGQNGEEQMHAILGRNATGCFEDAQPSSAITDGMMQR